MNWILPGLESNFGWNQTQIATYSTLLRYIGMVFGFIYGTIIVRKGVRGVNLYGFWASAACYFAIGYVQTLNQYLLLTAISGITMGAILASQFIYVSNWFTHGKGKIMGIVTIAYPVSSATFTAIATYTLDTAGWCTLNVGAGIFMLVIGIGFFLFAPSSPESVGLTIPSVVSKELRDARPPHTSDSEEMWSLKRIATNRRVWTATIGWMLVPLCLSSLLGQFIVVVVAAGIPINTALLYLSVVAVLGIPISYLWGWVDDKIGSENCCIAISGIACIGLVGMAFGAKNIMGFYIAIFAIACCTGGMPNLQPSVFVTIVGRKQFPNVSRYSNIFINLTTPLALSIIPVLYAIFGNYQSVFLAVTPLAVISLIMFILSKPTKAEREAFAQNGT